MSLLLSNDTRYVKLLLLLLKGGTYFCKKHTLKILDNDNTTIDICLKTHRDQNFNAFKKKVINPKLWELLSPDPGQPKNIDIWDISAHVYVLLNLFDKRLTVSEKKVITKLREKRNNLAHPDISSFDETKFIREWGKLTILLYQLSAGLTSNDKDYLDKLIDDVSAIQELDKAKDELKPFEDTEDFVKEVLAEQHRSYEKRLEEACRRISELERKFESVQSGYDESCRRISELERKNESGQSEISARFTVRASEQTARDKGHHRLLEASKRCLESEYNKQDSDEVYTACKNMFTDMSKEGAHLKNVEEGSVLVTFSCSTWTSLKRAILYLTKTLYSQRLQELEKALSQSVGCCVKLNVNIVLESLLSTLDKAEHYASNKSVVLTMSCIGLKGVRSVCDNLVNGSPTNNVNNLSEALSRSVDQRIELHISIDVDTLEEEISNLERRYEYHVTQERLKKSDEKAVGTVSISPLYSEDERVDMLTSYTPPVIEHKPYQRQDLTCKSEDNMPQHDDNFEEEFSNWIKAVLGLQRARDGSIDYIKRTMEPFIENLREKHNSKQEENLEKILIKVTVNGEVKKVHNRGPTKINWVLVDSRCEACDKVFAELLDMFINSWRPCKKWICNSTKDQINPSSYWWVLAKMYIAEQEVIHAVRPEEVEPLALFNLIKHCKLFDSHLRSVVDVLVQLRHRLMHSRSDRLTEKEMNDSFFSIKHFLKLVAVNPTETINEVEKLEKRTVIIYDENGEFSELAKEAIQQQEKCLNADFKAPEGMRGACIKSLAISDLALKQQEMILVESEKKHNKKYEELLQQKEDVDRKKEELEKKINQVEDLQRKNEELEEKVKQYEDLQRKNEELEEKVKQYEDIHTYDGKKKKSDIFKVKSIIDINIKDDDDIDDCNSIACCLTHDNQLLVTDARSQKLKRIDTFTMTVSDSCVLDSRPLGICCISKQKAAVACQMPNMIQFVSIENKKRMNPTQKIDTYHTCYGIATKKQHLYVTDGDSTIYEYDMKGTVLRTIINGNDGKKLFSMITHIAFNDSGNKMFVGDSEKGLVCFDESCNHLSTIKDNDLDGVAGVCTDGGENVFVIGVRSYNVVQFNEDGKKIGVVVKDDEMNQPSSISFQQEHSRMYMTMHKSDKIKVYDLV